jgi:hypothetical protein
MTTENGESRARSMILKGLILFFVVAVCFAGWAWWRLDQKPIPHALIEAPKTGAAKEPPVWFPKTLTHPCSECGTCVHKLSLVKNHLTLSVTRNEKTLFSRERNKYYFDNLDDFLAAQTDPKLQDSEAEWELKGSFVAPNHKHSCGSSRDRLLSDFLVVYRLNPFMSATNESLVPKIDVPFTDNHKIYPNLVPFFSINIATVDEKQVISVKVYKPGDKINAFIGGDLGPQKVKGKTKNVKRTLLSCQWVRRTSPQFMHREVKKCACGKP